VNRFVHQIDQDDEAEDVDRLGATTQRLRFRWWAPVLSAVILTSGTLAPLFVHSLSLSLSLYLSISWMVLDMFAFHSSRCVVASGVSSSIFATSRPAVSLLLAGMDCCLGWSYTQVCFI
jgi:hypothetical protein